jgi:hypothetical protein
MDFILIMRTVTSYSLLDLDFFPKGILSTKTELPGNNRLQNCPNASGGYQIDLD